MSDGGDCCRCPEDCWALKGCRRRIVTNDRPTTLQCRVAEQRLIILEHSKTV